MDEGGCSVKRARKPGLAATPTMGSPQHANRVQTQGFRHPGNTEALLPQTTLVTDYTSMSLQHGMLLRTHITWTNQGDTHCKASIHTYRMTSVEAWGDASLGTVPSKQISLTPLLLKVI